jgi:SAM-dependent methyltransferase
VSCAQCQGIVQEFDGRVARRELRRYRRRGVSGTARRLVRAIVERGVSGRTFLDVGAGVGAIHHELMAAGAASGTDVDASPAYLDAARDEARRRGFADRVRYLQGDFVALSALVDPADIVTLDRVLCCYPDMPALVDASASRARVLYGLAFPREHLFLRMAVRVLNLIQRLRRHPFRVFLHGASHIDARVRAHGFAPAWRGHSFLWQIHLYAKDPAGGARPSATASS